MLHSAVKERPTMNSALPMRPVERRPTLNELAYREIKELITSGHLLVDQIYTAGQFTTQLNVSRTPIREALLQLAKEGFLTVIDGQGFKLRVSHEQEIRDFFETRSLIESHVVGRLAGTLGAEDFARLDELVQRMRGLARGGDAAGFLRCDRDFHVALCERHGNALLTAVMQNIHDRIPRYGEVAVARAGRFEAVISEHEAIIAALRAGDTAQARAVMIAHLATSERYFGEGRS
jgi:DNA-binding GntR family transcriptional regulator